MKPETTTKKVFAAISAYLQSCYEHPEFQRQHLSGAGTVFLLEKKLRQFYNKKFAMVFSNATTALLSLSVALELKGSEIITSPMNWGGSVAPFLYNGSNLSFTAVEPDSLNMDIKDLKAAVHPDTKAVLSVDYNGSAVNSQEIKNFCIKNNLKYISDSSQSLGAFYNQKPSGFYADAIVLSFSPGKTFFAGEGGAILTDDEIIYEKLLWNSQHPERQKASLGISHYNEYAPFNGRMNPLSAIFLNESFESSLSVLREYQALCFNVLSNLSKTKLIKETPFLSSSDSSTFFNFSVTLGHRARLEQVNKWLITNDIPFRAVESFHQLIPYDPVFREQFRGKYKCTGKLQNQKPLFQLQNRITMKYLNEKS